MIKYIKKYRKWIFLTILLTFVFLALRFPWDKAAQKIAEEVLKTLPLDVDPDNVKVLLFPPGMAFYKSTLREPAFLSFMEIDELRIYPAFSKLLALKPAIRVFIKQGNSALSATLWLKNKKSEDLKIKEVHLKGGSTDFELSLLNNPSHPLNVFGRVHFRFKFVSPRRNLRKAEGKASLTGSNIAIKDSFIVTNLGNINLPDLKWSVVSLKAKFKEEELVVEKLQLGIEKDSLFVQLRGNMELKSRGNRFQLSYYDFQTQIEVNRNLKSGLINTLDIFLSETKTPIENGTRYQARIRGSGHKTPDIEKLSEF